MRGSEAVDSTLSDWQDDLVWTGLRQTLIQEAQVCLLQSSSITCRSDVVILGNLITIFALGKEP